jgi:N-acetylmuramoyl-L-alanine amidase
MNSEEKELLFTARWLTRERFFEPKTRVDLLAILNMLLSDSPAVTPTPAPAPSDRKRPIVAVVVGHNSAARGANALPPISRDEFSFNSEIADRMVELGIIYGLSVRKFTRFASTSYSGEIEKVYRAVDESNAVCTVELHFNSAGHGATGTETLHSGSTQSKLLAGFLQRRMLAALELRDRGLKEVTAGDRGGLSLHAGKAPCALVEPFFGSNPTDCQAAFGLGVDGFTKTYLSGLRDYTQTL